MKFMFNGRAYSVPGAYSRIKAINSAGASLPDFGIALIIAPASKGVPGLAHNADQYASGEASSSSPRFVEQAELAQLFSDELTVGNIFGRESVLYHAFRNFKFGGGQTAFVMNPAINTRTSVDIDATSFWSNDFGAYTNDIYVTIANGGAGVSTRAVEITLPRNTHFLKENIAIGASYVTLNVLKGQDIPYIEGDTVHLVDNAHLGTGGETLVIDRIDRINKRIYLTTATTGAYDISEYARLFQMDIDAAIGTGEPVTADHATSSDIESLVQLKEWFESTGVIEIDISSATALPSETSGFFGELGGATKGKSPAMTDAVWNLLQSEIRNVCRVNQVRYIVVSDNIDSANADSVRSHLSDWQATEQSLRTTDPVNPVVVISGCNIGDTFKESSEADSPESRASAMNNDRFILTDIGLDYLPSYCSLAPWIAGNMSSSIVNHNLTNDPVNVSVIEDERNGYDTEVGPRIIAGCVSVITKRTGYFIARGVNTLQDNETLWTTDNKTHSIMQRDLSDYCDLMLKRGLDNDVIGRDGITAEILKVYVDSTASSLKSQGYILEYSSGSTTVNRVTSGFRVEWYIKLDQETDWIGLTTNIQV